MRRSGTGLSTDGNSSPLEVCLGGHATGMTILLSRECQDLVEFQRGVVARWQAPCTADADAMDSLLRSGRWRRLYRGVYAAHTGPPSRECVLWAAVRRCGPGAALSHYSAAELEGFGGRSVEAVHVSIPADRRVSVPGGECEDLPPLVVHRSGRLAVITHPTRTPPRTRVQDTVLDLADGARSFDVAFYWLSAACSQRLVTPGQVRQAAACRKKLRWRADLALALAEISDGVASNLELGYARKVERPHGLPRAQRQVRVRRAGGSIYLDNFLADFGVAVEVDGQAAHPAGSRWRDIHRDNEIAAAGILTLRYSWWDVTGRPCWVAAQIAAVLRHRGWSGRPRGCGTGCEASVVP